MQRVLGASVLVAALVGAPAPGRAQAPVLADPNAPSQPVIVVTGESMLMLAPDRAYVQIGAEGRAQKPTEAQRQSAAAMTSVEAALKALGIASDQVRTVSYSLQPEYDYTNGKSQFRDYLSRNDIEVRVDDLAKLGDVMNTAGESGAASVSGLRFDLKNRTDAELDALQRAVRDAMARAGAIAGAAKATLGPVVRLQEQRTSTPSPEFRTATASVAGGRGGGGGFVTPVEPGQIQVRAQVTLTIAIR